MRMRLFAAIAGVGLVSTMTACGSSPSGRAAMHASPQAPSTPAAQPPGTQPSAPGDGGGGQAPDGSAAPAGGGKPDRCHTADLRGEFHQFQWPGQAGAESDADLGLTNTSGRPCAVYGYPGLQLIGADGKP